MLISQGDVRVFFSNWLVGSIMALGLLMLVWPLLGKMKAILLKSA
jgi:putative tricarboxylic transport membrane protein